MSKHIIGSRFEGRLFAEHGRLHMVVEVDEKVGMARISSRHNGEHQMTDMSLPDVMQRLADNSELRLDSLSTGESKKRVVKKDEGWFFVTREGLQGPFPCDKTAHQGLADYLVASQGTSPTVEPVRMAS